MKSFRCLLLAALSGAALLVTDVDGRAQTPASQAPLACLDIVQAVSETGRVALQGVHFDFNRAALKPESVPALVAARDAIAVIGGDWRIEGHTDDVGSHAYNQRLSEARALAVRDWLAAAGVPQARLSARGYSFERPIADNASEAGRALNRRVELVGTVDPDALGFGGPADVDPCPAQAPSLATLAASPPAEIPPPRGWQGAGGRDWLEFSMLRPTGQGAQEGAAFETAVLRAGTQPQTCQAMCLAEEGCAAWSFEPAGSYFVSDARCMRYGYGAELGLQRQDGYEEDGGIFVSGLRPDATNLVPETAGIADEILADMAEIAAARTTARLEAPLEVAAGAEFAVVVSGPGRVGDTVQIADLGEWSFYWGIQVLVNYADRGADGRLVLVAPEAGDYVLRYVIEHPRAGRHAIIEQAIRVREGIAGASAGAQALSPAAASPAAGMGSARTSSVEPGIDRPGADLAQTPLATADPLACQALCAADAACRAWTFVAPGQQGDSAMCWTKSAVPEGFPNDCCTSGVMDDAAAAAPSGTPDASDVAQLTFPMAVAPGESVAVTYLGPLRQGDWIDIVAPGNDDDMSGGFAWAWADGSPVTLTAPPEGRYVLRYVTEHPTRGRVVLAREDLVVGQRFAQTQADPRVEPTQIAHRCEAGAPGPCPVRDARNDLAFELMPGYGASAAMPSVTAAGMSGGRPFFDLVRLSDGAVVAFVNPRQGSGPLCLPGVIDLVCPAGEPEGTDAIALFALVGSLMTLAMQDEAAAGGEDGAEIAPGALQGVWVLSLFAPADAQDGREIAIVELLQDEGDPLAEGSFSTAPDFAALPTASGDARVEVSGEDVAVVLATGDGRRLLFEGRPHGEGAFVGDLRVAGSVPPAPVGQGVLRRVAGPGEDWRGAPWMHGETDGMAAALAMGREALGSLARQSSPEDRAMLEMLGQMLGVGIGGGASGAAPAPAAPTSPAMAGADEAVPAIDAETLLLLLAPHLSEI